MFNRDADPSVTFNPKSASEQYLAGSLFEVRRSRLRQRAIADLQADNMKPVRVLPAGVRALALRGFDTLSPADFADIKNQYNDDKDYAFVYRVYDNIEQQYTSAMNAMESFLRDNEALASDPIKGPLYNLAKDTVLAQVKIVASQKPTFRELADMTEILQRTQRGVEAPDDKNNSNAYVRMNNRIKHRLTSHRILCDAVKLFCGSLLLAGAFMCTMLAIAYCPILLIPAFSFAFVAGSLLLSTETDDVGSRLTFMEKSDYRKLTGGSSLFYKQLTTKPPVPETDAASKKSPMATFKEKVNDTVASVRR